MPADFSMLSECGPNFANASYATVKSLKYSRGDLKRIKEKLVAEDEKYKSLRGQKIQY
jgi:hypothetical protein